MASGLSKVVSSFLSHPSANTSSSSLQSEIWRWREDWELPNTENPARRSRSLNALIISSGFGLCRAINDHICREIIVWLHIHQRVSVSEKVTMFLSILAHHTKNRCVKFAFKRSGQTVSKHFHAVLNSVLRLHAMFLVKPQPIVESESDPRWQ
ncbi:hypothetical protein ACS0TY_003327 [Phlomoides rotata]